MHVILTVRVDQDDDLAIQNSERYHPFLTVVCSNVLTGHREVISDGVSPFEIHAMKPDVALPLGFVPGGYDQIVVTINSVGKPFVAGAQS